MFRHHTAPIFRYHGHTPFSPHSFNLPKQTDHHLHPTETLLKQSSLRTFTTAITRLMKRALAGKDTLTQIYTTAQSFSRVVAEEKQRRKMDQIPLNVYLNNMYFTSSRSLILVLAAAQLQLSNPLLSIPAAVVSYSALTQARSNSPYFLAMPPGLRMENTIARLLTFSLGSAMLGVAFSPLCPFPFWSSAATVWAVFGGAAAMARVVPWKSGPKTAFIGGAAGYIFLVGVQWLLSQALGLQLMPNQLCSWRGVVLLGSAMSLLVYQTRRGVGLRQGRSSDHLLVPIDNYLLLWSFLVDNIRRGGQWLQTLVSDNWDRQK